MEKKLKLPLKRALEFFEQNNYRYAVIGGIALSWWGAVRATDWLEQFAEALEQPDLLVRYRELQAKVEQLSALGKGSSLV